MVSSDLVVTGTDNGSNVSINLIPVVNAGAGVTICSGQSISLTASTVAGAAYSWMGPNAYTSNSQNPTIAIATSASGGTYSVTATVNACTSSAGTTSLAVNPLPTVSITPGSSTTFCQGGSVTLNAGSGYSSYAWNPAVGTTQSISVSSSGNYSVTVTNANNCSNTSAGVNVLVNPVPTVTITPGGSTTFCQGGSVTLNAGSGYSSYAWNPAVGTTQSISVSASGNYSVTVTNASNCSNTSAGVNVLVNPVPTVTITPGSSTTFCQGGSVTLNAGSGYSSYAWNPAGGTTQSISVSASGNYSVTVTNANNCSNTSAGVAVLVNTLPTVSVSAINVSCFGGNNGSALPTVTGGTAPFTYNWSNGETTSAASALAMGNYTLALTDANGCAAVNQVVSITQPATALTTTATATAPTSCYGICNGTATAASSGGTGLYTYAWNDGQNVQTVSGLCALTYTVTATDNNGCTATNTVSIAQPLPIPITATATATSCGVQSGVATVSISGAGSVPPFHLLWNTGDTVLSINNLNAGIYRANVKDGNGCFSFADALVSNSNGPVVTTNAVTDVACNGLSNGAIDINVTGGNPPYKYVWSNGSTTEDITNLSYGPYEVVVTDAGACAATQSIFVNEPAALSLTSSVVKSSCATADGSASAIISGGTIPYTYLWNPNSATTSAATGLSAGIYSVTITDAHGCSVSNLIPVSDNNGPAALIDTIAAVDCGSSGFVLLAPQNPAVISSYSWTNGSTTQNITNVASGNYGLVITAINGCKSALVVAVQPVLPSIKPICLVTVDTLTNKNIVVWEKPISSYIAGFNIYRESSKNGIYQLAGYSPYNNVTTFYDNVADPDAKWAKYRISMIDICGKEGLYSPVHKTIHCTIQSSSTITKTNLIWDDYIGTPFSFYHIFRKDAHGPWMLIDSVPSTSTVYSDSLFPQNGDSISYLIDVSHSGGDCDASIKKGQQPFVVITKSSKSNSSDRKGHFFTSVSENQYDKTIVVYPNPSSGIFTVQSSQSKILGLNIYNVLGEMVYQTTVNNMHKTEIAIPGIANGIYQIHIVTDQGTTNRKIMISK